MVAAVLVAAPHDVGSDPDVDPAALGEMRPAAWFSLREPRLHRLSHDKLLRYQSEGPIRFRLPQVPVLDRHISPNHSPARAAPIRCLSHLLSPRPAPGLRRLADRARR